ncbi:uncharacterized protein LOC111306011 isoform X2 [Durio zibethinus]|uniref:Uncharacterized protein LOC111306011 isoform X2 n=1 Tax=Durio zibethinus TaxID=66656 RepID=A0A6P6A4E0_DURZI|nr:uncharacterized protein LOC111306011 isoform X2 [Durio zibethinus]
MPPRNQAAINSILDGSVPQQQACYEGEGLVHVLKSIQRRMESERVLAGKSLPEKQFAIRVNDVTRLLERMAPVADNGICAQSPFVRLQLVGFFVSSWLQSKVANEAPASFGFIKEGTIDHC